MRNYKICPFSDGEFQQFRTGGNARVESRPDQCLEVRLESVFASTLTEELGVTESSVKTVVERGHSPGDDLDLRARQSLVMLILVVE